MCFLLGNNIDVSADLAGRCVLIDLHVSVANPQDRPIQNVIDERYLARPDVRADILSTLYSLVRNWDTRLRPPGSSAFRGFEHFSQIFSGIVEAAGYECPLSVSSEMDPDLADMTALVQKLCEEVRSRREYDFSEVVAACRELNVFEWHVAGPDELSAKSRSCLGKLFSRQFGGCTFHLDDGRQVRWGLRGKNRQRKYMIEVI